MKLYGKRFARRAIKKATAATQETRDAILWDVLDDYTCRIKIQGSDEYVIAHYPRNWKSNPYWLKKGNAVRVLHRGGNRGYVEVIGEGRAIPTALSGSSTPDESTLPDMMVSGGEIASLNNGMWVELTTGAYRIDGVLYSLTISGAYRFFDDEDCALYDSEDCMLFLPDSGNPPMVLDAAPASGYFRYDAFCIGADGVIDYLKGTAVTSNPAKPVIPGDHVLIGSYILVVGGVTTIEDKYIGMEWTTPYLSSISIDIEDEGISYNVTSSETEASIVLTKLDQYGNSYTITTTATITKNLGGGAFSETSFSMGGTKLITWSRNGEITEDMIVFTVETISGTQTITAVGTITVAAAVL